MKKYNPHNAATDTMPPTVLVTRPTHQTAPFIEMLKQAGIHPVCFPTIEIEYTRANIEASLASDLIIFTSVNAVHGANNNLNLPWQSDATIAAIGAATKKALTQLHTSVDITPVNAASTEALLEVLGDVALQTVTIVRGDTGRDALFNALRERHATVRYQAVYKRVRPAYSSSELAAIFTDRIPDITSVTSDLGLTNLLALLPDTLKPTLFQRPLVVNSQRCASLAREAGFTAEILVATPAGDTAQTSAITTLLSTAR